MPFWLCLGGCFAVFPSPQLRAVRFGDARVPAGAVLGQAAAGGVVHVHQAEPLAVAAVPFVVVHQRPVEVPAHVRPAPDAACQRAQVAGGEVDAAGVVDLAVQADPVVARKPVFADVQRQAVALGNEVRAPVEAVRFDRPADGRARVAGRALDIFGARRAHAHRGGVVDVQAEHVGLAGAQRGRDLARHARDGRGQPRADVFLRPAPQAQRVQRHLVGEGPVVVRAGKSQRAGGGNVGLAPARRVAQPPGGGKADPVGGVGGTQRLRGQAVRVHHMLPAGELPFQRELQPRRVQAVAVAHADDAGDLVDGEPVPHAALEVLAQLGGVLCKGLGGVDVLPAALVLQRLGQVPVVKRDVGLDAFFQQGVHQFVVIGQAPGVPVRAAGGGDARPGDAEPVGAEVHVRQQLHVLAPAVVAVAGDVAGLAAGGLARRVGKCVPDAGAAAAFGRAALDLVGRGRRAPNKVLREERHKDPPSGHPARPGSAPRAGARGKMKAL